MTGVCVVGGMFGRGCVAEGMRATHATPVNRMTDACENITLPQTSFAGGNKRDNADLVTYLQPKWFKGIGLFSD